MKMYFVGCKPEDLYKIGARVAKGLVTNYGEGGGYKTGGGAREVLPL